MDEFNSFSKVFESHIRLQMIASLFEVSLTYSQLKEICNCSDGNMGTHTKKLIKEGFIIAEKKFVNNKPMTTYILTEKGKASFIKYVKMLNKLIGKEEKEHAENECKKIDTYTNFSYNNMG